MSKPQSDNHWLTRPQTLRWLWIGFTCLLLLTVGVQFFIPIPGSFSLSGTFAFAAWFGFGVCVVLVMMTRVLGWLLQRPESYYQQTSQTDEVNGVGGGHD